MSLKTGKASGDDHIINECLNWGAENLIPPLTILFIEILDSKEIPPQWMTSTIILLQKKGPKDD